jgi:hypothetical protein
MKVGNLEVLKVVWMQGDLEGQVGVIKTKDTITKELKYFIGYARNYKTDNSEAEDIKQIIAWGTKFLQDEFIAKFSDIVT